MKIFIPTIELELEQCYRKVARRRTAVLPTETGSPSSREAPIDCPDWAKTLTEFLFCYDYYFIYHKN